ncbi:HAD family hydrolase [Robertmurraya sp. Marseille-Q9965]
MDFSQIKVIVFDLDGTLYEDTHHFEYQAARLKEKLPLDKQPLFEKDFQAVKDNNHPLRIGRIYDAQKDLILVYLENHVQEVYDWDGNKLPDEKVKKLYPEPIEYNLETMINVGDPWWTSTSIAIHYGLNSKQSYQAFLETRAYMMGPDFEMEPIDGFKEALEDIHRKVKLVLLTNSPQPDSEAILTKIGLAEVLDFKIFNGEKPIRTIERFEFVKNHFNVQFEEILSVGDNWINEIHPVQSLGCKTIFIDPHGLGNETSADLVVKRMGEIIPLLNSEQFV